MRRNILHCIVAAAALAAPSSVFAQDRGAAPRPGPEHARLGFFVGDWSTQSEIKPGPWGPGAKLTGRDRCAWMEGRFFVTCNTQLEGALGKLAELTVLGYDVASRRYMRAGFRSDGQTILEVGAVETGTWTFNSERGSGNRMIRSRAVFTEMPPDRYEFRIEVSPDGSRWDTLAEGTATRQR